MATTGGSVEGEIRSRRTRTEQADLDITPMIDIVFLLLAFFVMVTKLDPKLAVELPMAEHGFVIPEKQSVVVVVTAGPGQQPEVYKGFSRADENLLAGPIEEQEEALEAYVEQVLRNNPEFPQLLIKAEAGLRMGDIERIKRAAQRGVGERPTYLGVQDQ